MGLLKRLILWIVRIVCSVGFIVCVAMAITEKEHRVVCIIIAVILFLVVTATTRKSEKIKAKSVCKCKHCKQDMHGASYKYEYKLSELKEGGELPVVITLTCPHCGKEKFIIEYVYVDTYKDADDICAEANKQVEKIMKDYFAAA